VYAATFLTSPAGRGASVLGRRGARLLALTCGVHLAIAGLDAGVPERFAWTSALGEGLDLLAWAWVLYAAPSAALRVGIYLTMAAPFFTWVALYMAFVDVESLRRRLVGSRTVPAQPGERSAPRLLAGAGR